MRVLDQVMTMDGMMFDVKDSFVCSLSFSPTPSQDFIIIMTLHQFSGSFSK